MSRNVFPASSRLEDSYPAAKEILGPYQLDRLNVHWFAHHRTECAGASASACPCIGAIMAYTFYGSALPPSIQTLQAYNDSYNVQRYLIKAEPLGTDNRVLLTYNVQNMISEFRTYLGQFCAPNQDAALQEIRTTIYRTAHNILVAIERTAGARTDEQDLLREISNIIMLLTDASFGR